MKIKEYLKNNQPIPYQVFENALKKGNFSHAYLLSGPKGSSLGTSALFLAKSLNCLKANPFACESCSICERIEHHIHETVIYINAKNGIKIQELKEKIDKFFNTPIEKYAKNVYIIENIDYLKTDAINMILKFLEEPPLNTYAIFTTENELGVLPTILSRVQIIRFSSINKEYFIGLAAKNNISKSEMSLLFNLYNDLDEIKNLLTNPNYLNAKNLIDIFFNNIDNKNKFIFLLEKDFLNKKILNNEFSYFTYDLLLIILKEALKVKYHENTTLIDYDRNLIKINDNIKNIEDKIQFLMEDMNLISKNINLSLLLLNSFNKLFKD